MDLYDNSDDDVITDENLTHTLLSAPPGGLIKSYNTKSSAVEIHNTTEEEEEEVELTPTIRTVYTPLSSSLIISTGKDDDVVPESFHCEEKPDKISLNINGRPWVCLLTTSIPTNSQKWCWYRIMVSEERSSLGHETIESFKSEDADKIKSFTVTGISSIQFPFDIFGSSAALHVTMPTYMHIKNVVRENKEKGTNWEDLSQMNILGRDCLKYKFKS